MKDGPFQGEEADDDEDNQRTLTRPAGRFMMELLKFPKLICAAVNGPTVGIGVTLLLHCDLCYCTKDATFWSPFTRLALVPEFCSSVTLLQTMGLSNANELLLLAKKIDASKAVQNHLCSEIIKDCDTSGNPFHEQSIASKICIEIDTRLLSFPNSMKTMKIFVSMIRARRRKQFEKLTEEELRELDERINNGDVLEAVMELNIGKSKL